MFSKILKVLFGVIVMFSLGIQAVNTEEIPNVPLDPYKYGLYESRFPAACGPIELVNDILNNRGFKATHASLGRLNAHPNGKPVFMIMIYRNKDQLLATIETPQQVEKCMMFISFNTYEIPQNGENTNEPK
jgi:hypothetical protein